LNTSLSVEKPSVGAHIKAKRTQIQGHRGGF